MRTAYHREQRNAALALRVTEETGLVPSREYNRVEQKHQTIWHVAWFDGNLACGRSWRDVEDPHRRPARVVFVCPACRERALSHPGIAGIDALITRANEILR